jgi:hypothetical protein
MSSIKLLVTTTWKQAATSQIKISHFVTSRQQVVFALLNCPKLSTSKEQAVNNL